MESLLRGRGKKSRWFYNVYTIDYIKYRCQPMSYITGSERVFKNILKFISLSHEGQNQPFLGHCLPSWKILDNPNNVKSDF
jgi:hypothetical protein